MSKIRGQKELYSMDNVRIGILGGTFDPPHLAHLHMAESALKKLNLDYIVFMPLGVAPHGKSGVSTSLHRIKMLEIILSDHGRFYIDDYETKIDAPSYTIKSAERINNILGKESKAYFLIGADSLMYLEKWRDAKKLLKIARFAVIPREGYSKRECKKHIKWLEDEFDAKIEYIDTKKMKNSSTDIRLSLDSAQRYTTEEVLKYIKDDKLYEEYIKEMKAKQQHEKQKDKILKYLKKHIKQRRYEHVMGTAKCAVEMAKEYDVDEKKAELAAILHDCAKEQSDSYVMKKAIKYGFQIDEMYEREPQLLHGAAGALIAKEKFEIVNDEILEAICYHTVPKPRLCDLAKIIYVADKIESTRSFKDLDEIRDAVGKESLDNVFLMTLKRVKLAHILKNKPLHPSSLDTYNHLIMNLE